MKAEKRHELQKNELADWIGAHAEGASDYFWPIVGGVVAAFALAVGIVWYLNTRDTAAATAWDKYYQAFSEREREAELKKVADSYSDSTAAQWARLSYADMTLAKAADLMFNDRSETTTKLKEAQEAYQSVIDKARDPELLTRAQYGMARVLETNCKPEEAKKYYELVAKANKESPLSQAAARDAERMSDPKTVEFLNWFATATPRKPVPTGHGGFPGLPPLNVPTDLPERPDLSLPGPLNFEPGKLTEETPMPTPPFKFSPDDAPKGTTPEAPKNDAAPPEAPKSDDAKPAEPKKSDE
jgi:tetratricopeptide (TPR) repeat protein